MNKPPDGWVPAYKLVTRGKRRSPVAGRFHDANIFTYKDDTIMHSELKLSGRSCDKGIHAYPTFTSRDLGEYKSRMQCLGLRARDDKRYVILRVWAPSWYSPAEFPFSVYTDAKERQIVRPNDIKKVRAATVYVEKEVGYVERGGHWVNTERET